MGGWIILTWPFTAQSLCHLSVFLFVLIIKNVSMFTSSIENLSLWSAKICNSFSIFLNKPSFCYKKKIDNNYVWKEQNKILWNKIKLEVVKCWIQDIHEHWWLSSLCGQFTTECFTLQGLSNSVVPTVGGYYTGCIFEIIESLTKTLRAYKILQWSISKLPYWI